MSYEELYEKCKSLEEKLIRCDHEKMRLQEELDELKEKLHYLDR